jgi:hypothetical protein
LERTGWQIGLPLLIAFALAAQQSIRGFMASG